jgi:tRNA (guanine-N7-)-methyltransferase
MTAAQERALHALFPKYGIAFADSPLRSPRNAPLVLEIGSGMGETTAAIAAAQPHADFVAVEVHGPGVGSLLNRIEAQGLKNLRIVRHDALEVLERMVDDGSLAAIHLFFPDPWPKKRHHKRRLVRAETASLMARKLAPGGVLHAATDWPDYAQHIAAVLGAEPLLESARSGFASRPETKFEGRGKRLGHPIQDLYFRRRSG